MGSLKENENIVNHNQQLWETSLHKQTPGYQTKQCAPKLECLIVSNPKMAEIVNSVEIANMVCTTEIAYMTKRCSS